MTHQDAISAFGHVEPAESTHLQAIVRFVNEHEDGTPQPRASVVLVDGQQLVAIRSTSYHVDDPKSLRPIRETDYVRTLAEARLVLGY